jgi:hypothetical protein
LSPIVTTFVTAFCHKSPFVLPVRFIHAYNMSCFNGLPIQHSFGRLVECKVCAILTDFTCRSLCEKTFVLLGCFNFARFLLN